MTTGLLTIPETADRLKLSRRSVYALISAGALRPVDVSVHGRTKTRIREDDLQKFIDGRTRETRRAAS